MAVVVSGVLVVILLSLAYQDWKERQVSWLFFLPFSGVLIYQSMNVVTLRLFMQNFLFSFGYLIVQMALIWLYFRLKTKRKVTIINTYFGLGDLLLLLIFTLSFSAINYVIFLTLGMLFSIVLHLLIVQFSSIQDNSVPLVTYFSIFYLLLWSLQKMNFFEVPLYFFFVKT